MAGISTNLIKENIYVDIARQTTGIEGHGIVHETVNKPADKQEVKCEIQIRPIKVCQMFQVKICYITNEH